MLDRAHFVVKRCECAPKEWHRLRLRLVLLRAKETVFNVGEITCARSHPTTVGMGRDAGDVDRSGRDVDEEQNVMFDEAPECMHLSAQKVRSRQAFPLGFQKSRPSSVSIPLRSRLDAVLTEDSNSPCTGG